MYWLLINKDLLLQDYKMAQLYYTHLNRRPKRYKYWNIHYILLFLFNFQKILNYYLQGVLIVLLEFIKGRKGHKYIHCFNQWRMHLMGFAHWNLLRVVKLSSQEVMIKWLEYTLYYKIKPNILWRRQYKKHKTMHVQ